MAFQYFYIKCTWLFWAYLMKVILSVSDEGYSERTWWRLFWAYLRKVIPAYLMKVIPAYLMKVILSVPDEGYSECTWWRLFWAYLMKVILSVPDEGYSERTWWSLFKKPVVCTKFDIYIFIKSITDCVSYSTVFKRITFVFNSVSGIIL